MYIARITFLTRRLTAYTPDTEDWAWYGVMPTIAYASIFIGAIALLEIPAKAMFVVAGGVVLLIFTGIRNAWDVVTYLAIEGPQGPPE